MAAAPNPADDTAVCASRLLARTATEYDLLVRGLRAEVAWVSPDTADQDPLQAEVSADVCGAFRLVLPCLTGGRHLTVGVLAAMRDLGAAQARRGVPLATVERGVRTAVSFCHCQLLRAARAERPSHRLLDAATELSVRLADLASEAAEALVAGYACHQADSYSADPGRHEIHFVESVLEGGSTEEDLRRAASELGHGNPETAALLVIVPPA